METKHRKGAFLLAEKPKLGFQVFASYSDLGGDVLEVIPAYSTALKRVIRAASLQLQEGREGESDLEHVIGIGKMWSEVKEKYPILASNFDSRKVDMQIAVHDAPEIIVGDVDHANTHHQELRTNGHKARAERHAFFMFIVPLIPVSVREEVVSAHLEFEAKGSKESLMAHMLDILQGNRQVCFNYLNANKMLMAMNPDAAKAHVQKMALKPLQYAENLSAMLGQDARTELWQYLYKQYDEIYSKSGWLENTEIQAMIEKINNAILPGTYR